jgi:hypothetical protein
MPLQHLLLRSHMRCLMRTLLKFECDHITFSDFSLHVAWWDSNRKLNCVCEKSTIGRWLSITNRDNRNPSREAKIFALDLNKWQAPDQRVRQSFGSDTAVFPTLLFSRGTFRSPFLLVLFASYINEKSMFSCHRAFMPPREKFHLSEPQELFVHRSLKSPTVSFTFTASSL